MPEILYEDGQILVVRKPAGQDSQDGRGFSMDLSSELKNYLARKEGGVPYLGIVHRLDRPVAGVMVFAKTKKAAASLSRQVLSGEMNKQYYALLCGLPGTGSGGVLMHYLVQDRRYNTSAVTDSGAEGAKRAELCYEIVPADIFHGFDALTEDFTGLYLAKVTLKTGRHHQIRVQFAAEGAPLWGDDKYNPNFERKKGALGLCAYRLTFLHPATREKMEFEIDG